MIETAAQRFDPRRGSALPRPVREQLEKVHKDFAGRVGEAFETRLGVPVTLDFRALAVEGWAQCRPSREELVIPFRLTPGEAYGFLKLSADAVKAFLEVSLGGHPKPEPNRSPLTLVEREASEWPLRLFLSEWNDVWETFGECAFNADEASGAEAAMVAPEGEPHLIAAFDWTVGGVRGRLQAALPLPFVRPLLAELEKGKTESQALWTDPKMKPVLLKRAEGVSLAVRVRLAESEASVRDMAGLEAGDVVRLGTVHQSAVIEVGGIPIFKAKAGLSEGRLAVRVLSLASSPRSASS